MKRRKPEGWNPQEGKNGCWGHWKLITSWIGLLNLLVTKAVDLLRFVLFSLCFCIDLMISINVFCWNCKGGSNMVTLNRIKELIKLKKQFLVCLMEMRTDESWVNLFYANFYIRLSWAIILTKEVVRWNYDSIAFINQCCLSYCFSLISSSLGNYCTYFL